jgi:DNA-binding transcriptional ArsR family regulator
MLTEEIRQKVRSYAQAASLLPPLGKVLPVWQNPEDFLRPKDIVERLESNFETQMSSSALSTLLRVPTLCGLLDKQLDSTGYKPTPKINTLGQSLLQFGQLFDMSDPAEIASFLSRLSTPHTWAMLEVLQDGAEHSVSAIVEQVNSRIDIRKLQQPEVTSRLMGFSLMGIVQVRPEGKYRYYSSSTKFDRLSDSLADLWHPSAAYFLAQE